MVDFAQQRLADNKNACRFIDRKILARELELVDTTWFGYRFMSPWQRSQHFEKCYAEARKKALALRIGTASAETKKSYSVCWTSQNRELTKLWKARQRADELCLPYEIVLDKAFEITELAGRKNICLPEQLIPDWHKDGQEKLKTFWAEKMYDDIDEKRWVAFGGMRGDAGAPFRQEHFNNLKAQTSVRDYLISERARQHKSFEQFILTYGYKERMLDSKAAKKIIALHPDYNKVIELIEYEKKRWVNDGKPFAAPVTDKETVCTLQGCYGLRHYYDNQADCEACPLQKACKQASEQCEIETCGAVDGADPVTVRKRGKAAERKRRSRRNIAARKDPTQRQRLELIENAANKYGVKKTAF